MGKKSDGGIINFQSSGQIPCHNSRTSNDIYMEPLDQDVLTANHDLIVIFLIYGWFGVIWKPDSGCLVYNSSQIFIKNNLLSSKNWKQLQNLQGSCHTIALSKVSIFAEMDYYFAFSAKIRGFWYYKVFYETTLDILTYQISSF